MTIRRDTGYNLLGQLAPLALSLLTIPLYLRLIGEARFGVLALMWLFFGYMGLFDLGVGQATVRQLSRSDRATPTEAAQVLWTALLMSLGLGWSAPWWQGCWAPGFLGTTRLSRKGCELNCWPHCRGP